MRASRRLSNTVETLLIQWLPLALCDKTGCDDERRSSRFNEKELCCVSLNGPFVPGNNKYTTVNFMAHISTVAAEGESDPTSALLLRQLFCFSRSGINFYSPIVLFCLWSGLIAN